MCDQQCCSGTWPANLLLVVSGTAEISPAEAPPAEAPPAKGSPAWVVVVPAADLRLAPVPPRHQASLMSDEAGAPNVGPSLPLCQLGLVCQLELLGRCWAQQQEAKSAERVSNDSGLMRLGNDVGLSHKG